MSSTSLSTHAMALSPIRRSKSQLHKADLPLFSNAELVASAALAAMAGPACTPVSTTMSPKPNRDVPALSKHIRRVPSFDPAEKPSHTLVVSDNPSWSTDAADSGTVDAGALDAGSPARPELKRHDTWFHIGAMCMCVLVWVSLWFAMSVGATALGPHVQEMATVASRVLNGQYTVTCKLGDLPLNHLRCIFFLRLTNWFNWVIVGVSKYLGGLEDPRDMFCFACTVVGTMYFTLWRLLRRTCGLCVRITCGVYRHTYNSMNNPSSPFRYMDRAMQLSTVHQQ